MTVTIRFVPLTISWLIALILLNYFGQRIINKKEEVFYTAYFCTKWYLMPVEHRRMILMILKNSSDFSGLSAGKMGEVSMEAAGIVSCNQKTSDSFTKVFRFIKFVLLKYIFANVRRKTSSGY